MPFTYVSQAIEWFRWGSYVYLEACCVHLEPIFHLVWRRQDLGIRLVSRLIHKHSIVTNPGHHTPPRHKINFGLLAIAFFGLDESV